MSTYFHFKIIVNFRFIEATATSHLCAIEWNKKYFLEINIFAINWATLEISFRPLIHASAPQIDFKMTPKYHHIFTSESVSIFDLSKPRRRFLYAQFDEIKLLFLETHNFNISFWPKSGHFFRAFAKPYQEKDAWVSFFYDPIFYLCWCDFEWFSGPF